MKVALVRTAGAFFSGTIILRGCFVIYLWGHARRRDKEHNRYMMVASDALLGVAT
jgi:hypothetical protein